MKRIQWTKIEKTMIANLPTAGHKRKLDADDIATLVHAVRKARKAYPGLPVTGTVTGGYVANSYRYSADADQAGLTIEANGTVYMEVSRYSTQRRPHGNGDRLYVRVIKPGQVNGSIVARGL